MMKRTFEYSRAIAVFAAMLMAACSAPPDTGSGTNNTSPAAPAAASANNNAPAVNVQTPTNLNGNTAPPTPEARPIQPAGAPAVAVPAEKPASKPGNEADSAPVHGPRIVVVSTEKELDFGKQPQDKTMTRSIRIKNGGTQDLKIESVVPS